jgi:hypothetical protein
MLQSGLVTLEKVQVIQYRGESPETAET